MRNLKSTRFKKALKKYFTCYENVDLSTYWYEDNLNKINDKESTYENWLSSIIPYLKKTYNLSGSTILDVGSGFGIHATQLALANNNVVGIDICMDHLSIASVLNSENNCRCLFLRYDGKKIPLKDRSVDIVTMFTCVEHIDDKTLNAMVTELHRVCRGVIYILVPNRLSIYDTHIRLYFLPLMPRRVALSYIRMKGNRYTYEISDKKEWDVHYRTYFGLKRIFENHFVVVDVPKEVSFPPASVTSKTRKMNNLFVEYFHFNRNIFEPFINIVLIPKSVSTA